MKKNKRKKWILMALAGLLLFTPLQGAYIPEMVDAAQVSDPHDSKLSAFDIAPGTLSPTFSPDILEYTATVDAGVTDVSVQAVPRAAGAVIASVEGRNGLRPGVNTVKATCSAQDNTVTVYTITLTVGSADAGTQPAGNADGTQPGAGNTGTEGGAQPDTGSAGSADGTAGAGNTGNASDAQPDAGSTGGTQPGTGNTDGAQPGAGNTGNASDAQLDADKAADKKSGVPAVSEAVSKLIGKIASDGTVTLNGASYRLSSNFIYGSTAQDIPSAFGQGTVEIKGNSYSTLYCEANKVHLVYMENTDGNGSTGFYFYDKKQKAVERFKYTGIGDNFVVFISAARKELPAGFQETVLTLPSGKDVVAYQDLAEELADYYLIYGIHSDGSNGWYLYDQKQGTYMRYSSAFLAQPQEPEEEKEVARTVSLEKYNTLNERFTELKKNRVRIVSVMAVVMVLLIILFTAVLLRVRDDGDDGGEEDAVPKARKTKKAGRQKKQPETISKSSLAAGRDFDGSAGKKAKKVTKNITQEPFDGAQRQPAGLRDSAIAPEEIRAQISRGQTAEPGSRMKKSRGQDLSGQNLNGQRARERGQKLNGQREQKLNGQRANEQKLNEQRAYEQRLSEQQAYGQKLNEQRANEQKLGEQQAYGQKLSEQQAYGQKLNEQRANEQKLSEQQAYGQKLNEQRAYEQKLNEQRVYEQKRNEQRAYEQKLNEQKLNEQRAYEQKLNEQRAYEQKLNEQRAYEQKLNEQRAYEQRLNEQQAYEQKLNEQRAYEQKLNEQRAYEQKLNEQRAYEQKQGGQHAYATGRAQQPRQAGTFGKSQPAGSQDSVQLAAEKMRQSMRYSRKGPETGASGAQGHDPMDDWDMDEAQSRKTAKSGRAGRKKRGFMDEDVEIMDLNDL